MSTVLWGARRGDVQYASPLFWNQNLPLGVPTIAVDGDYFRYGELATISDRDAYYRIVGRERIDGQLVLAVELVTAQDYLQRPTRGRDRAMRRLGWSMAL